MRLPAFSESQLWWMAAMAFGLFLLGWLAESIGGSSRRQSIAYVIGMAGLFFSLFLVVQLLHWRQSTVPFMISRQGRATSGITWAVLTGLVVYFVVEIVVVPLSEGWTIVGYVVAVGVVLAGVIRHADGLRLGGTSVSTGVSGPVTTTTTRYFCPHCDYTLSADQVPAEPNASFVCPGCARVVLSRRVGLFG